MNRVLLIALAIGLIAGVLIGHRSGRHHQHARTRYRAWRAAIRAVPIAFRAAVDAFKSAVGFVLASALVIAAAGAVIWKALG